MKHITTMAMRITEDTYPIAVACLPAVVATMPVKNVVGKYLVINDLSTRHTKDGAARFSLEVGNSWMPKRVFKDNFAFVKKELPGRFAEVKKI